MGLTAIILAAGQGKRMHSTMPKVLHCVGGQPMLAHVLDTARLANAHKAVVVYGCGGEQVQNALSAKKDLQWVEQEQQLGTAHAVQQALPKVNPKDLVIVLYGDSPLIRAETINRLVAAHQQQEQLTILTFIADDPAGYGRIVRDTSGEIQSIVEHKDANPEQLKITEVNSGVMLATANCFTAWIEQIESNNAQGEFYLTDCVQIARQRNIRVNAVVCDDANELLGVNDRVQLAQVEKTYQQRMRHQLLIEGVTLQDPDSVYINGTVSVGQDVVVGPGVEFNGTVHIGDYVNIESHCRITDAIIGKNTRIHSYTHIEKATIGDACELGPFARLRPETMLRDDVKIGNFAEIKKASIERGSKVNHLSYIGDCTMGAHVNIGAGTIVCNYDGANKHHTTIGDHVFIGSDTQLVAPVTIGEGATIGAGSTITKDAPAQKLSLSRAKQISIENWQRPRKGK